MLEKLRANEPLNAKEKVIHEQGLVSVLKDIHDRLDAAVFDAYGWPVTLTDEQIIEKLVALNAERAAEEKKGFVRWLRPEFQNPEGAKKAAQSLGSARDEREEDEDDESSGEGAAPAKGAGWPKSLGERMALVRDAVQARGSASAAELAKQLGAKKPAEVAEVLDGLAMLGHLRASGSGAGRRWSVAGRRAA